MLTHQSRKRGQWLIATKEKMVRTKRKLKKKNLAFEGKNLKRLMNRGSNIQKIIFRAFLPQTEVKIPISIKVSLPPHIPFYVCESGYPIGTKLLSGDGGATSKTSANGTVKKGPI